MYIGVNCGHTKAGPGYGAVGMFKESEHTRFVGYAFMDKLKKAGVGVLDCTVHMASTQGEYLEKAVNIANKEDLDWFVSIHFNATTTHTGQGVEVYTYEGQTYKEALKVCSNLEKFGFKNRGVKSGTGLYVIRKTKAKAMLIEICFCDNATDVALYEQTGVDGIAQAIFSAFFDSAIPSSVKEENHNMSRQDFIEYVGAIARRDWRDTRRVLPSVVVAQAIKESGAGTSELARKANALFGIKENGWTGKTYIKDATEQRPDGSYYQIPQTVWRAYDSWEESILDHNDYIATKRIRGNELLYEKVIGEVDYKKACFALQEAGYATSLTYGKSLIEDYIEKENLLRFDLPLKEEGDEKKLYRVQVGAFRIQENAVRFANTMNQKGIETEIIYL